MDQDASGSGKTSKKKKKARSQTADAMLESLKKGGDLEKSFNEDTTALNNTFNAEDSPRYTKNTTNARRKKLPPKKGNVNRGYVDDEEQGMEMTEMGKDDGLKKKKKKTAKKKVTEEDEEETAIDPTMTVSELEHTPKKPKRRRKKNTEEEEQEEEQVVKETDEDQIDGEAEEGNGTPRGKGKKKKKKKKSTNLPMPADDGQVLGVIIHRSDRLKPDLYIAHPLVRVHIVDLKTGKYVMKSSRERAVTSYYETKNENLEYILPILTQPFDFKKRKSMTPCWEDQIIFNESYQYLIQERDDCPKIIIFFEILDFVSMNIASTRPRLLKGQGTWHRIAWAFLKLVGSNGAPNTEKKVRLQLFYPPFAYKAKPDQVDVFQWWENIHRQPYPATLYVTVKSIKPPQDINPATRSLFATQEERGLMTYKELKETMSMRNKDQALSRTNVPSLWSKLPGQTCRIPNKEILSLAGDKKGCHVIKFSPDGHHIACGCKDKDGYPVIVYEIPDGREKCQFPGHYGLIYDIRWSPSGNDILTASSDGTARIWHIDMPDSAALKVFPHPSFVYTARYHPGYETFIITGGYDNFIRVWSTESNSQTGELMYELKGHEGFVNSIAFSPDGTHMYSGDSQGRIIVWKSAGSNGNWMIKQHVDDKDVTGVPINSLQVHPSGRRLLVHCRDNHIRMLDLRLFCMMQNYVGVLNFREQIRSVLSPCGSFVFSGSEDRHGYVWNTDTGEQVAAYTQLGYRQPVCDVDYHPHEHMVALCSRGEGHPIQIYIYDAKVAHLTMGFARTKLGKEADDGNVTEEEERLIGTLRTKHDIDQDIEDKKQERLARVKRKLASVMALKQTLKAIQNAPSDPNKTNVSMHTSSYTPAASSAPYETWGSTFDYTSTPWQTQTPGTLGFTGGRGGPGWTSTPYKKGPMPTINLNAYFVLELRRPPQELCDQLKKTKEKHRLDRDDQPASSSLPSTPVKPLMASVRPKRPAVCSPGTPSTKLYSRLDVHYIQAKEYPAHLGIILKLVVRRRIHFNPVNESAPALAERSSLSEHPSRRVSSSPRHHSHTSQRRVPFNPVNENAPTPAEQSSLSEVVIYDDITRRGNIPSTWTGIASALYQGDEAEAVIAHLTMGFARTKLGKEADDGNVTEEEERLIGTLRTKHDIDQI
nr:jouberin-like [Lytechinus pictus]